ncbi:MAG TPA: response regulator transcription factor [Flavisolibacter sp.]|nr:response regulator transcription factor [Flavisolibacter sp.]
MSDSTTTIAIVDDHKIFCDSLASLINDLEGFTVTWTAEDGEKAIAKLNVDTDLPNILLLDINMPRKNGLEVAEWLFQHNKTVHILALTMENDEANIIKMLQFGVRGYLLKSISAEELYAALQSVMKYGFYYTPLVTKQIGHQLAQKNNPQIPELKDREKELLQLMCTDLSYTEIAQRMFLSESTVDTYRARLFEKFDVKNRIGLLLKANNLGLVKL